MSRLTFDQELKQHRPSYVLSSHNKKPPPPPPRHQQQQQHIEVCVRLRPLNVEMNTSSSSFFHSNTAAITNTIDQQQPRHSSNHSSSNKHSYMNGTISSTASTSSTTAATNTNIASTNNSQNLRKPSIPRPGFTSYTSGATSTAVANRYLSSIQPQKSRDSGTPNFSPPNTSKPSSPDSCSSTTATTNNNNNNTTATNTPQQQQQQQYAWTVMGEDTVIQNPQCGVDIIVGRTHTYTLDHVYGPSITTQQLYRTCIQERVHAAVQGYHATILAYGQTATGKTHTMTGTINEPGIIPLSIRECFSYIKHSTSSSHTEYLLRLSYMEVYKEHIKDLLAPPSEQPPPPVRLFEGSNGHLQIRGIREIVVTSPEQVFTILADGESRRHVNATHSNTHSSRSHVLVRIWIESRTTTTTTTTTNGNNKSFGNSGSSGSSKETVRVSSLSLVDLAGSESVRLTGSTERQSEGHYINKSLMTLGQVVYALSEQSSNENGGNNSKKQSQHIPYRDSKLTRLLQPSLSGNAQVVLLCCISPLSLHIEESHNTFKFAIRAKKIPQKAIVQEQTSHDDITLLQSYRSEIEDLKQQLKEAQEMMYLQRTPTHQAAAIQSLPSLDEMDEDNDEMKELMSAIQKMEQLILKTQPGQHEMDDDEDDDLIDISHRGGALSQESSSAPNNNSNTNDIESRLLALTVNNDSLVLTPEHRIPHGSQLQQHESDGRHRRSSSNGMTSSIQQYMTPPRNFNSSYVSGNDHTSSDGNALQLELARIQGLLGSVMKKRYRMGQNAMSGSSAASIKATEEVRSLRAALEQQEVATSLRQADSSFLQAQLEEKDNLLAEVSKLLETVEERQSALEAENLQLRKELEKYRQPLPS